MSIIAGFVDTILFSAQHIIDDDAEHNTANDFVTLRVVVNAFGLSSDRCGIKNGIRIMVRSLYVCSVECVEPDFRIMYFNERFSIVRNINTRTIVSIFHTSQIEPGSTAIMIFFQTFPHNVWFETLNRYVCYIHFHITHWYICCRTQTFRVKSPGDRLDLLRLCEHDS